MCYHVLVVALSRSAGDPRPLIWWPSRHTLLSQAHTHIILIFGLLFLGLFWDLKLRRNLLYNGLPDTSSFPQFTGTYFPSFLFLVKQRQNVAIKFWQLHFFSLIFGQISIVCESRIWSPWLLAELSLEDPTNFPSIFPNHSRFSPDL